MKVINRATNIVLIVYAVFMLFTSDEKYRSHSIIGTMIFILLFMIGYPLFMLWFLKGKTTVRGIVVDTDPGNWSDTIETVQFEFDGVEYCIYHAANGEGASLIGSERLILINVGDPSQSAVTDDIKASDILVDIAPTIMFISLLSIALFKKMGS